MDIELKEFHSQYVELIKSGNLVDTAKPEFNNDLVQPTGCAWQFTIHKPTEENIQHLIALAAKREANAKPGSKICWELEVGWGEGKKDYPLHIQGYMETSSKQGMIKVKNMLKCNHAHIEPVRGSYASNEFYTSKDFNNPGLNHLYTQPWMKVNVGVEHAAIPKDSTGRGRRNDLDELKKDIKEGILSSNELKDKHTDLHTRFPAGVASLMTLREITKPPMKVYWHWGVPGSGKTYDAKQYISPEQTFIKPPMSGIWFQGYDPMKHKTVVLDEVDKGDKSFSLSSLLNLMDESLIQVQIKNGSQWFIPEILVLTSTKSPRELYPDDISYQQIIRRCDEVIEYTQKKEDKCKLTKFSKK